MRRDGAGRVAVVLFNLGAPDRPSAVRPFLRNLFRDPAILRVPPPIRALLARVIAGFRVRPALANYALLGGSSPLLDLTRAQAAALQSALPGPQVRCFVAMRYWHPFGEAAARAVRAWRPDRVVLLPLYPQYSSTTTGSSVVRLARGCGESWPGSGNPYDLLLCDRSGLHRCGYRATAEGPCSSACRVGGWCTAARPVLGPWPAGIDRGGGRPISVAGGADGRGGAGRMGRSLRSSGRSATSRAPRHSAGSNPAPLPRSSAPRGTRWACLWSRLRSSPNIPRHLSSSMSSIVIWPTGLVFPAISVCRRRAQTPRSFRPWPRW